MLRSTSGTLTLLRSEMTPSLLTMQTISLAVRLRTVMPTRPSSMRMVVPSWISRGRSG